MAIFNSYVKLPEGIPSWMGSHKSPVPNHQPAVVCDSLADRRPRKPRKQRCSRTAVSETCRHHFRNGINVSGKTSRHGWYNVGPHSDVRWFINPMNTIVIGTINHSDIGVINQLVWMADQKHMLEIKPCCLKHNFHPFSSQKSAFIDRTTRKS